MMDQAEALRELVEKQNPSFRGADSFPPEKSPRGQIIAITSGKGGVGKTNVVVNLAISLRRSGKEVAILDADFGLANVDVLLGLNPTFHLGHVIEGIQPLRSVIVEGPEGIHIIPASSGIQELTQLSEEKRSILLGQMMSILDSYDFVLVDTAAGISDNVVRLLAVSRKVIVVSAPEPTAIVDAYALIKVLLKRDPEKEVLVLVNSVLDEQEAKEVFDQLARVVDRFLGRSLQLVGFIPRDEKVQHSVRQQKPVVLRYPRTLVTRCFERIAEKLVNSQPAPAQLHRLWQEVT